VVVSRYKGVLRLQYLDHLGSWHEISCDKMTFEPSGHVAFWRTADGSRYHLLFAVAAESCVRVEQLQVES
jgi:hypothetical protein